jgi:hypothetical protein
MYLLGGRSLSPYSSPPACCKTRNTNVEASLTILSACAASAMRIVFTVKIAPVIAEADVSHNGLFIGLWTEAEVSLGFIVACALCLPKLVQAKGSKLKRAMSKASSPFSSSRGTVHSVSRRDTVPSQMSMRCKGAGLQNLPCVQARQIHAVEAVAHKERYYRQPSQQQMHTLAGHLQPGTYAQSVAAGSSVYSQSPEPRRPNIRDRSSSRDSSILVAPLRVSMYGEQILCTISRRFAKCTSC